MLTCSNRAAHWCQTIYNGFEFGILDSIIVGHSCQSDKWEQDKLIKLVDIIVLYKPTMKLHPLLVEKSFLNDDWPGFEENTRIHTFVYECLRESTEGWRI